LRDDWFGRFTAHDRQTDGQTERRRNQYRSLARCAMLMLVKKTFRNASVFFTLFQVTVCKTPDNSCVNNPTTPATNSAHRRNGKYNSENTNTLLTPTLLLRITWQRQKLINKLTNNYTNSTLRCFTVRYTVSELFKAVKTNKQNSGVR